MAFSEAKQTALYFFILMFWLWVGIACTFSMLSSRFTVTCPGITIIRYTLNNIELSPTET